MDRTVLITGASRGIGAATAIAFAREGADVAARGRGKARLRARSAGRQGRRILRGRIKPRAGARYRAPCGGYVRRDRHARQ